MELNMRTIRYFDTVLEGSAVKEESADVIVPDLFPDIARIVGASGLVVIREKTAWDGRAELSGVVRASVLYVPEGEQGLRKIDVALPFSHVFEDGGLKPDVRILPKAVLLDAEARPVNPRKVQVSVKVLLESAFYAAAEWSLCEDIGDAGSYSAQLLKTVEQAYMPVAIAEKSFHVSDEMEVPGSRPPVTELLRADVRLLTQEVKPIGNKLVLKGSAVLHVLYLGPPAAQPAEEIHLLEEELPFSQIIEMEALEEGGDCTVDLNLASLEIDLRAGLSGESRILGVSLQVEAQAVCVAARRLESVADLYSTAYDVHAEFRAYPITRQFERAVRRVNVRESLAADRIVSSVIDAQAVLWPMAQKPEDVELCAEAYVKVVYLGEDQQFYTLQSRLPVRLPREAEGALPQYRVRASIGGGVQAAGTHEGVEVRFAVDFDITEMRGGTMTAVVSADADMQSLKDHAGQPSVVLCRCRTGDSLWSIAKKFNSTRDDLMKANHLCEDEEWAGERVLLIPRRR